MGNPVKKGPWDSEVLSDGFQDLVEDATPRLTRADFDVFVVNYLKEQKFSHEVPPTLLASLFKKTLYCLKQLEAFQKMRPVVRGPDWKAARKILHRLTDKELPAVLSRLRKNKNPNLPITDALVGSVLSRIEAIKEDLELTARFARNDEELVAGYLKPELDSQFMLELDNYLARELPDNVTINDRRLVVGGCALAAKFFPSDDASEDIQNRIVSRIERARHSNLNHSNKWKWTEQE